MRGIGDHDPWKRVITMAWHAHSEHRAGRSPKHLLRHRAQEQSVESAAAMRAHDDQVGRLRVRPMHDRLVRAPLLREYLRVQSRRIPRLD